MARKSGAGQHASSRRLGANRRMAGATGTRSILRGPWPVGSITASGAARTAVSGRRARIRAHQVRRQGPDTSQPGLLSGGHAASRSKGTNAFDVFHALAQEGALGSAGSAKNRPCTARRGGCCAARGRRPMRRVGIRNAGPTIEPQHSQNHRRWLLPCRSSASPQGGSGRSGSWSSRSGGPGIVAYGAPPRALDPGGGNLWPRARNQGLCRPSSPGLDQSRCCGWRAVVRPGRPGRACLRNAAHGCGARARRR